MIENSLYTGIHGGIQNVVGLTVAAPSVVNENDETGNFGSITGRRARKYLTKEIMSELLGEVVSIDQLITLRCGAGARTEMDRQLFSFYSSELSKSSCNIVWL